MFLFLNKELDSESTYRLSLESVIVTNFVMHIMSHTTKMLINSNNELHN